MPWNPAAAEHRLQLSIQTFSKESSLIYSKGITIIFHASSSLTTFSAQSMQNLSTFSTQSMQN